MSLLSLNSDVWAGALEKGLNAKVLTMTSGAAPALLAIFRAGPFRLGYLDFPVGRFAYGADFVDGAIDLARAEGVDVLRFHSGTALPQRISLQSQDLGTRCITNLQGWSEAGSEKARRARNRKARSALRIEPAVAEDAPRIYQLYLATLGRHGGNLRYRESYLKVAAAMTTFVARLEGVICAFVSIAELDGRACYLHGGYDPAMKAHYPSDQLFYFMIHRARDMGMATFDFLPSPVEQHSLIRYKEAWGGEVSPFFVSDAVLRPLRGAALRLARRLSDLAPRVIASRILERVRH